MGRGHVTPLVDQFAEVAKRLQELELARRLSVNIPAPAPVLTPNPEPWRDYLAGV